MFNIIIKCVIFYSIKLNNRKSRNQNHELETSHQKNINQRFEKNKPKPQKNKSSFFFL